MSVSHKSQYKTDSALINAAAEKNGHLILSSLNILIERPRPLNLRHDEEDEKKRDFSEIEPDTTPFQS